MIALDRLSVETSVVVEPTTPLLGVVEKMSRADALTALVVDDTGAVGILTHQDIVHLMVRKEDWGSHPVRRVMSTPVLTVDAEMPCDAAYQLMLEKGLRQLVLNPDASGRFRVIGEKAILRNGRPGDDSVAPRVSDIMQTRPLLVPPDAGMHEVISLMAGQDSDYVIVAHHGLPLGIITESDVFRHCCVLKEQTGTRTDQIMTTPTLGIDPSTSPDVALEQMEQYGVDRLLVVGLDSRVQGVLSLHQLIADRQRRDLSTLQANLERCEKQQFPGQLLEVISDGVLVIERGTGLIVQANPQLAGWLDYRAADMTGMPLSALTTADQLAAQWGISEDLVPIAPIFRTRLRKPDRGEIPVEVSTKRVTFDQRPLVVAIVRDLTRQQASEAALRASEESLDLALRGADLGLWDWNIQTGEVTFNVRWAGMLGYKLEEIEPHVDSWSRLVHPEDMPGTKEALQRHLDGETPAYGTTHRLRHKDGSWRWILDRGKVVERDSQGRPLRAAGTHMDITESRAAQERLRLVATVFENSNEGVLITDEHARIVEVNPSFSQITGYSLDEVLGKTPKTFSSGRHDDAFYQVMWRQLNETGSWAGEIWNRRKCGEIYPEWLSISSVHDDSGRLQHYVAVFSDVSEQHRSRQEIEYLAHHDALTDLPNRLLFNARLEHAIGHAIRARNQLAVLCIDLDRFKTINDSLGHASGDQVLRQVATRIRLAMRADDTMARLGGDEFIILLENVTPTGVREVAEKVTTAVSEPLRFDGDPLYVSLSMGISMFPRDGRDVDTLVKNADIAMYKAKSSGRDNYQFYTQQLTDETLEQVFLQNHLRRAIEQDEFRVYYQPQVDIETGLAVGVEALLRWQHPDEGLILPMRFIPLLEEQGMMRQVGPWVLRRACEDFVRWQKVGIAPDSLAVNLSGPQIHSPSAADEIERILLDTGMPAERLELEVTENFVMTDPESNINTLHRLRALGIRLAIDDFGTGYSSLAYLKRLPINKLKIDRSFVRDVPGDVDDEAITRAVVGLSKTLNLDIIAEGVERLASVEFLLGEGCYFGQGFLWGKPMPEEEIVCWLAEHLE